MNRLMLSFYHARYWLGSSGLLAVLLLIALPFVWWLQIHPMQQQLAELESQPMIKTQAETQPTMAPQEDAAALKDFYAQFSSVKKLPDILQKLESAAARSGVRLERGDFKLVEDKQSPLMRYEMNLPVKAGYKQVRQFIDTVSREIPTMGLSEITLKREELEQPQVEARLDFVLYLQGRD